MSNTAKLFEHLSYMFISIDSAFSIRSGNLAASSTLGIAQEELSGTNLLTLFHPDDQSSVKEVLSNNKYPKNLRHNNRWRKVDGSYFWCQWELASSDEMNCLYLIADDVSEQRSIKSAMESLEKVTDTGYWELDPDTKNVYWSTNVHKIHETDPSTYQPKLETALDFYHPDSLPTLMHSLDELDKTGKEFSAELKLITNKQKHITVDARCFSESLNGKLVRSYGTFRDLTKQKANEAIRRNLQQRILLALKGANIGIWDYDLVTNELVWDDRVFEIYGKSKESFKGTFEDWKSALHPDDLPSAEAAFTKSLAERNYFDQKFRVVTEIGELRYVHGMASFDYDNDGNPIKVTGINIDLTESETIKNDLRSSFLRAERNVKLAQEMAEKAKAADQQKSAFLANMSHEIRTPISGIVGLVDILIQDFSLNQLDSSKKRDYLALMKSSSAHLLTIISDILDFSKIEAGKIQIHHEAFEFVSTTQSLFNEFERQADLKGVSFDFQHKGFENTELLGDPLRLKQILYNLLGNAIKFTQDGKISVRAQLNRTKENDVVLVCSVLDTGIGIAHNKVDLLFKPFEQVDSSAARAAQGTGLGLTITNELIKLMSGSISVDSTLGEGSRFIFKIPMQENLVVNVPALLTPNITDVNSSSLAGCMALVAEDNEINQAVVECLLNKLNITCVIVKNGNEALSCLQNVTYDFDFILMDCQMPVLDGFETTKIIRNNSEFATFKNIPIIALTANALIGDKEKCLNAGMDAYLSKPVTSELLSTAVLSTLDKKTQ